MQPERIRGGARVKTDKERARELKNSEEERMNGEYIKSEMKKMDRKGGGVCRFFLGVRTKKSLKETLGDIGGTKIGRAEKRSPQKMGGEGKRTSQKTYK